MKVKETVVSPVRSPRGRCNGLITAEGGLFPKKREIRTALEIIAAAKSDLLLACEKQREELEAGRVLQ